MIKTVRVTKNDIINGTSCNEASCPIALAIKRHTGLDAKVGWSTTKLTMKDGSTVRIKNNDKIMKFVDEYDLGHHVRGFSFTLDTSSEVPDPYDF